jgi:Ca2+-transporting ATPase
MTERKIAPPNNEQPDLKVSWHSLSAEDVLHQLQTPAGSGLSSAEVGRRQAQFGPNELTEKSRPGFWRLLLDQLRNFIVILLIVAAFISFILGEYVDAIAILAIVILNAVLGVVQESRAEQALAALKKLAAPDANALRDGRRLTIPASQLVPGDLIFLETGDFVPADVRLLETANLRVDESALTGESVPVQKSAALQLQSDVPLGDRKNTAFMGTTITYGRGQGVVVATGMRTQLGMIAAMLETVEEKSTPLQRRLDQFGRLLGYGALAVCGLVFAIGVVRAVSAVGLAQVFQSEGGLTQLVNLFMIAVSLAIAAVPEGLPAVVTISLALGMREMVRRHALIRRLSSVETLGSATVICSDKTGTLTQNEMTLTRMWVDGHSFEITGSGYTANGDFKLDGQAVDLSQYLGALTALWVGVLNNDAQLETVDADRGQASYRIIGDPTEGSILVAAAKAGIAVPEINKTFPRQDEIPFDATRKRMVTVHDLRQARDEDISPIHNNQFQNWEAVVVKGAPDLVLNLCSQIQTIDDLTRPLDETARRQVLAANDEMTRDALRVLGLAYRLVPDVPAGPKPEDVEKDLVFAGLVGMIDPPRIEATPALQSARQAGIRTIMITGDYPNTAQAVARAIGLLQPGHQVLTGSQLNQLSDGSLRQEVAVTDVFARVSPEHKMRIVDALRERGEVVAMTGDGVNDAPAIKRADIGVAMGITGTDVAKQTADMVLTDDNYASIVSAIEQGRIIYSNIRKFVYYLVSCNIAEILIIFLATLVGWGSPLTAIQILMLNLVTDGAPALALATEKGDPHIMRQRPRPPDEPIINRFMRVGIAVQAVAITAVVLAAYAIGRSSSQHLEFAETMAFATLTLSELLRAFTARSEYFPLLKVGIFSNHWMNYAALSSLVIVLASIYVPFLNIVFQTNPLGLEQWLVIIPLLLVPSIAAELTKTFFAPKA